jgi:hypothetical protein
VAVVVALTSVLAAVVAVSLIKQLYLFYQIKLWSFQMVLVVLVVQRVAHQHLQSEKFNLLQVVVRSVLPGRPEGHAVRLDRPVDRELLQLGAVAETAQAQLHKRGVLAKVVRHFLSLEPQQFMVPAAAAADMTAQAVSAAAVLQTAAQEMVADILRLLQEAQVLPIPAAVVEVVAPEMLQAAPVATESQLSRLIF